jgi:hypothetical protein
MNVPRQSFFEKIFLSKASKLKKHLFRTSFFINFSLTVAEIPVMEMRRTAFTLKRKWKLGLMQTKWVLFAAPMNLSIKHQELMGINQ